MTCSSYHMEEETLIEASCTNNIHTVDKNFCSSNFLKFVNLFFSDRVKTFYHTLVCMNLDKRSLDFAFLETRIPNKYCLWGVELIFLHEDIYFDEKCVLSVY